MHRVSNSVNRRNHEVEKLSRLLWVIKFGNDLIEVVKERFRVIKVILKDRVVQRDQQSAEKVPKDIVQVSVSRHLVVGTA